jgi:hypothetical protein
MNQDQINDMYKQPTAVDWLFNQIPLEWTMKKAAYDAYRQAKQMEKEQIIAAWNDITTNFDGESDAELYYNKTYQP